MLSEGAVLGHCLRYETLCLVVRKRWTPKESPVYFGVPLFFFQKGSKRCLKEALCKFIRFLDLPLPLQTSTLVVEKIKDGSSYQKNIS